MAGSITGTVVNQLDGQQIEGAQCQCMPEGGETRTDGKGNFAFSDLAAGYNYELVVRKEGFYDGIYGPLVVIDGHPTELALSLQPKDF